MQYTQSQEKAAELAEKVLKRISKEGLAPTPELYELWYVYYAELNPELVRAVDILIESGQQMSDDRCLEIHQRFLSEASQNARVKQAGDQIQDTIQSVGGVVTSVKSATKDYNDALSGVSSELARDDIGIEEARGILENVVSNTQDMMQENEKLELALSKSTAIMHELKRDLDMVRKEALTDGLTSLANRKAFDNEISELVESANSESSTFCLIMVDIDHFKDFNDSYGHQIGDQVLRLVAKTLFDGVKGRDMVARYGGEEFAILLPDTDAKGGMKLANALRVSVASKEIVNRNSNETLGRINLSGGVAEYTLGESADDIIERADAGLYASKRNGRNQISCSLATGAQRAAN